MGEEGGLNLYAYVGGNPMNGVDPLGLTVASNIGLLFDYLTGWGPRTRPYAAKDFQNSEMQNSPGAQHMRDEFEKGGCKSAKIGYGSGRAAWDTLLSPSQWGNTGLQVGGFLGSTKNNSNGTVTYSLSNVAGAKSFFYHVVPNTAWSSGPLSNIKQTFSWTESQPCSSQASPAGPSPSFNYNIIPLGF